MAVDWDKPIQCLYDNTLRPARYLGRVKTKHTRGDRLVAVDHGDYESVVWTSDGGDACEFRLVTNVPQKHVRWVNMYPDKRVVHWHTTKEHADKRAAHGRIACIRIEFEEGEGLE